MSQKAGKRSRKHTSEEELDPSFKVPNTVKVKEDSPRNNKDEQEATCTENGNKKIDANNVENEENPKRTIQTRSQSNIPSVKSKLDTNEGETETNTKVLMDEVPIIIVEDQEEEVVIDSEENGVKLKSVEEIVQDVNDACEPPVATIVVNSEDLEVATVEKEEDAGIPELVFEDYDLELEAEASPSRCKTRRSQIRNVSTPKTPKATYDQDVEPKTPSVLIERLPDDGASGRSTPRCLTSSNDSKVDNESQPDETVDLDNSDSYSSASMDNVSTKAVAGSDATRNTDFTYNDSNTFDENAPSMTNKSPNRSLAETLRCLSSRRTIRPISGDYRRFALQNTLDHKEELYPDYDKISCVSVGVKRKNRSSSLDSSKRFKEDSSIGFSYISNIKSMFSKTSTPKLIAYEKTNDDDFIREKSCNLQACTNDVQEKKWCSIM